MTKIEKYGMGVFAAVLLALAVMTPTQTWASKVGWIYGDALVISSNTARVSTMTLHLPLGAIQAAEIAALTIDSTKLGANSVNSEKIYALSVTGAKIAALAIDTTKLVAPSATDTGKVLCAHAAGGIGYCTLASADGGVTCGACTAW